MSGLNQVHDRSEILFLADAMLGKLARYLRMGGVDTAYRRACGGDILAMGGAEGRVVLTRDTRTLRRWSGHASGIEAARDSRLPPGCFDPGGGGAGAQFRLVWRVFGLGERPRRRRCSRCNAPLDARPMAESGGAVPDHIIQVHPRGGYCSRCDRWYWPGSHTAAFRRRFADLPGIADVIDDWR